MQVRERGQVRGPACGRRWVGFGAAVRRTVYVTGDGAGRAEDELRRHPRAGSVCAMGVDVPGRPEPRFVG